MTERGYSCVGGSRRRRRSDAAGQPEGGGSSGRFVLERFEELRRYAIEKLTDYEAAPSLDDDDLLDTVRRLRAEIEHSAEVDRRGNQEEEVVALYKGCPPELQAEMLAELPLWMQVEVKSWLAKAE